MYPSCYAFGFQTVSLLPVAPCVRRIFDFQEDVAQVAHHCLGVPLGEHDELSEIAGLLANPLSFFSRLASLSILLCRFVWLARLLLSVAPCRMFSPVCQF